MGQSLIYQIDKVLYFFSLHDIPLKDGTIAIIENIDGMFAKKLITQTFKELNAVEFHTNFSAILDKLKDDELLKEEPEIDGIPIVRATYNITFKGRLWLEQKVIRER